MFRIVLHFDSAWQPPQVCASRGTRDIGQLIGGVMRARDAVVLAIAIYGGVNAAAFAQTDYPRKNIRLVVPSAPGGGTDLIARLFAQKLGEAWGQAVVVDNQSGGATTIGTHLVAKAA